MIKGDNKVMYTFAIVNHKQLLPSFMIELNWYVSSGFGSSRPEVRILDSKKSRTLVRHMNNFKVCNVSLLSFKLALQLRWAKLDL